jgi:hypothetical protein
MSNKFDDMMRGESEPSKWRESITWSGLIILGLLIYELTTQPILGVIVICSKFGCNDFLIAYWLPKVDPNRARSRAVFWFWLASGLVRVVLASTFLAVGLFLILGAPFGQAAFQAILLRAISAYGVTALGYFLITVIVFRGVTCARQSGTKVWLTPAWPFWGPGWYRAGKMMPRNFVDGLLVFALLPVGLLGFEIFPAIGIILEPNGLLLVLFIALWLFWCGLLVFLLSKTYVVVKRRFLAANPFECWDCDALGKAMIAKIPNARRVRLLVGMNQELVQVEAYQSSRS